MHGSVANLRSRTTKVRGFSRVKEHTLTSGSLSSVHMSNDADVS